MSTPRQLFVVFAFVAASVSAGHAQTFRSYSHDETQTTPIDTAGTRFTLQVDSGTAEQTGEITGTGSIEKTGAGNLSILGNNSYSGGTYLNAGNIYVRNSSALGSGPVYFEGGNLSLHGGINFASDLIVNSSGTLAGTGGGAVNTFSGWINVNNASDLTLSAVDSGRLHLSNRISGTLGTLTIAGNNSGSAGDGNSRVLLDYAGDQGFTGDIVIAGSPGSYGALQTASDFSQNAVKNNGVLILNTADTLSGTRVLGSLSGTGVVRAFLGNSYSTVTLQVGGLNTDTTFAGRLERDYFGGVNNGKLGLEKVGTGILKLTGANNTYTGETLVRAGTLLVNSYRGTGSGYVIVDHGGTLGGSGTIQGTTFIENGGILAPGNSPGTLTFESGLTLNNFSILDFELGTTSDLIRVSGGNLTGSTSVGGITINLADAGGFTAATYTLIDFSGASRSNFDLTDFTFGSTLSGYTYSLALVGSTLQLTASAIPEPSTYALLAGLACLAVAVARKRATRALVALRRRTAQSK